MLVESTVRRESATQARAKTQIMLLESLARRQSVAEETTVRVQSSALRRRRLGARVLGQVLVHNELDHGDSWVVGRTLARRGRRCRQRAQWHRARGRPRNLAICSWRTPSRWRTHGRDASGSAIGKIWHLLRQGPSRQRPPTQLLYAQQRSVGGACPLRTRPSLRRRWPPETQVPTRVVGIWRIRLTKPAAQGLQARTHSRTLIPTLLCRGSQKLRAQPSFSLQRSAPQGAQAARTPPRRQASRLSAAVPALNPQIQTSWLRAVWAYIARERQA